MKVSFSGWRRVSKGGLICAYMNEKSFRNWVRSVLAIAFLPINRIEGAIDRKRDHEFDKSSPFYDKMEAFKTEFLDYMESTWINGNYSPKIWNQWKKTSNLTNNNNEGYNSKINKLIACLHPNPWILLCTLVRELLRSETELLWVKDSNPKRQKTSSKYEDLVNRRKDMMEKYAKKEVEEDFFLQRMGAISLKLARVAHKTDVVIEEEKEPGSTEIPAQESDSDSMSETRPLPQSEDSNTSSGSENDVAADAFAGANRMLNKQLMKKPITKKSKQIFPFLLFWL
jgi:hypothetical protein